MVDKRATDVPHLSHIGTESEEHHSWFTVTGTDWGLYTGEGHPTTKTNAGIYHLSHIGTKSQEHHSWSTKTLTPADSVRTTHLEHTRHPIPSHTTVIHAFTHLPVPTHSTPHSPSHLPPTVENRAIPLMHLSTEVGDSATAEDSHESDHSHSVKSTHPHHSAHSTHGSHSAKSTRPLHTPHSAHASQTPYSTHSAVHHTYTVEKRQGQDENWTGTEHIHMSTAPVVGTTESASIPFSFPPDWAAVARLSLLPPPFGQEKRFGYLTPPRDSRESTAGGPLSTDPATVPHFLPTDNWLGGPHAPQTFTFTTGTSVETITLHIATHAGDSTAGGSAATSPPSLNPSPCASNTDLECVVQGTNTITVGTLSPAEPTSVPHPAPTRNSRGPRKSTHTVNPSTFQNATTIALPSTTYCLTTLYLPHSPEFRPGTKTVWISTTTLYPEWDCHGCPSLTVVDPWAIGQPTSHYHHTKTSSSVLSVASPVCRPSQTSIDVILTAA